MKWLAGSMCLALVAGCPAPADPVGGAGSSSTAATSTTDATSNAATDVTGGPGVTSTTAPATSSSSSGDRTTNEPDPDATFGPGCDCDSTVEVDPIPRACADLEVPPVDPTQVGQLSGWMAGPTTVVATTHEAYLCTPPDFRDFDVSCPCVGWLRLVQLDFAEPPVAVGPMDVTLRNADAACADACDKYVDVENDFGVQVLAASEACVIIETVDWTYPVRFYVDLAAC